MADDMQKPAPEKDEEHKALARSYSWYFLFFLAGVLLDIFFPIRIFNNATLAPIGFIIAVLATLLIFWAQKSSRHLDKSNLSSETFRKGPYKYTHHPTHLGLFLLLLGFALMANAMYLLIFTALYGIFAKLFFFKEQDSILEAKYGSHFREYRKSVKIKF
jgi:protein-S-isoprenylcysteine O-methyltransferase Ste14